MANGFLGLICGLKSEAESLGPLVRDPRLRVAVSGAHAGRAASHARTLVDEGATGLLTYGVSGGLSSLVSPGDLIAVTDVVTETERWAATERWTEILGSAALPEGLALHYGSVLGSDRIIGDQMEKQRLGAASGALAVDMESHSVARVAAEAGLPFGGLRAVADGHDQMIPPSAAHGVASDGSVRPWAVIAAALRRPADFVDLIRVGRASARAHNALGRCAGHVLPRLLGVMHV